MDLDVVYIGKNLRDARFRAGLTQEELAKKAGVTQTTITRIERDAVQPEVTTVRKLAAALDVSIAGLLED
jgi:transcriptional regulator with XRE-family HTH domain